LKYCTECLQPDTRPNTVFSDSGVCPACIYQKSLETIDWDERFELLSEVVARYKNKSNKFDCIVGVSGGKDSTRQALFVRDRLCLKPLLVCLSYPPEQFTERGADNISNLINLGFDVLISQPAPRTWRHLKKEGFRIFTNSFRSTEMALFASVPQIAIRYNIRLILWGENPSLQLGDMKTLGKTGYDGNRLRYANTLSSGHDWMLDLGVERAQIIPYIYPSPEEFDKNDLQIVYLGWFWGDWSEVDNAAYSSLNGLHIRDDKVEKTGDLYGVTALDEDFTPINQVIKYYKFGFGRVTDFVNEDIRLGRISRAKGIPIIERYDHVIDSDYLKNYCQYLGIQENEFWEKIRAACNKDLFYIDENGSIQKKFKVGRGLV